MAIFDKVDYIDIEPALSRMQYHFFLNINWLVKQIHTSIRKVAESQHFHVQLHYLTNEPHYNGF